MIDVQIGDLVSYYNDKESCGIVLRSWNDYPEDVFVVRWIKKPNHYKREEDMAVHALRINKIQ